MLAEDILNLLDLSQGFGQACNKIQDAAYETMTDGQWNSFSIRQEHDYKECEGNDYLVFNGQYFDWKEFDIRIKDIVMAYLSYFTEPQLKKIYKYIRAQIKGGN